jgi:GT2 family glycosyltransferase
VNPSNQVAAIILNWNCAPDTLRCLDAVLSGSTVPQVFIVDNGSADDSVATLEKAGDQFNLVALEHNLGYAGGMNAGIRAAHAAGAQWVWLLNADCVPGVDALRMLLENGSELAAATSVQVTSSSPQDAQAQPYLVAATLPNGRVKPLLCGGCAQRVHPADVVTGAALLIKTQAALEVGLLDERFFHYKEEFDLVVRIARSGGKVGLVCASKVWHQVGGSLHSASARARYYYARNEVLYVRKHYPRPLLRMALREPVHYKNLALAAVGGVFGRRHRRLGSRAVLAGYWDGLRGVHGPTDRF